MQTAVPRLSPRIQENELRAYALLIWRWLWLILLCTVVAGITAFLTSRLSTPIYQATATLLINEARSPSAASYTDILTSERVASTYSQMMTQRPILAQVADDLGLPPDIWETDITAIQVTSVRDTQLVRVSAEGTDPNLVMTVANTLPAIFIDKMQEIQTARYAVSKQNLQEQLAFLETQIADGKTQIDAMGPPQSGADNLTLSRLEEAQTQYQSSYSGLLQNYETLRLAEAQSVDSISVVEPAVLPENHIRPRTLNNTLLAAIAGAMLALGVIFLIEYLDDRVRSPDELSAILGAPWLGVIAAMPDVDEKTFDSRRLITQQQPRHPISESFRTLRTNLQFSSVDTGLRSLLLTSASPGEGKTTMAANLAVVMAQAGRQVVLVDADLRRPVQHKVFEVRRSPGLADALLGEEMTPLAYLQPGPLPNLRILTCGHEVPNPAELLGSRRMQELIQRLQEEVDLIIIDSPPVLAVTDAQVLGRLAQGVLLVVDANTTSRNEVIRAAEAMRQVNIPLLGAVVNRLSTSSRGYYYYYHSYYQKSYYGDGGQGEGGPDQNGASPPKSRGGLRARRSSVATPD